MVVKSSCNFLNIPLSDKYDYIEDEENAKRSVRWTSRSRRIAITKHFILVIRRVDGSPLSRPAIILEDLPLFPAEWNSAFLLKSGFAKKHSFKKQRREMKIYTESTIYPSLYSLPLYRKLFSTIIEAFDRSLRWRITTFIHVNVRA